LATFLPCFFTITPDYAQYLKVLDPDWVKADKAPVWCYSCENWVTGIAMTTEDESQIGNLIFVWTDLWYCSSGHKLHEATQEIRRFFRKS